ncbi:MAG: PAS domain S-box protein, partial [Candidatus Bathyarchaeia archaeon]
METLPYVILGVGVSFLAIVATIRFTLIHHEVRNKVAVLIILGSIVWLLMSALGLASDSLPTKLVFFKLQFVGVLIVPTTWLINTMQFSGYERWIKRSNLVLLSAVPIATLLLIFTNPHGLMWSNLALNPVDPFLPLFESRGLGYWLLIAGDAYVVLMLTLIIFVRKMVASRSVYRRQAVPMIFVSCVPWTLSVVWFLNPSLFMYIDPTALGLTVATSILFWRLADLPGAGVAPVAHELIFDSMNEAVIILDAQTRIVELNPRAQQLVGHNLSDAIGKPVDRIWAEWADVKKELDSGTERVREVPFGVGEEKKIYEMQISYLSGIMSERPNLLIILRDITERKRAEEQLNQSVERYQSLFNRMLDGIYLSTHAGRFVDVNPAFVRMFGYANKQEMLDIADIKKELYFSPEERGSHLLDTGQDEVAAYRMRRKDGSEIWAEDHGSYVHDEQGNIAYHEGIMRDITERKRIENALQESERRLRLVTDHMLDMIIRCDLRGIFEYVSPSHRMLGYEPKDLVGKSIFELIHPDDLERSVNAFLEGFQDRSPKKVEIRFKHADGHYIWIESVGNPIFDEKDEVSGAIIGSRDITERKRMEDELRRYSERLEELVSERTKKLAESESRFRELADLLPQPVFEIDNEAKFTFVNRAGFALTGYTEEDMRSVNALDLVVPEDQERLVETIMRILGGERVSHARGNEYTAVRKDGSTFPVFLYGVRVMRGNDVVGLRAIAVDISERKQMEEELLRSRRLAAIGETAALVGHDLRNPLQAMTGTLYLVKKLVASEKAEDRKEAVGLVSTLNDGIRYMDKIVSDLQDYARPVGAELVETSLPDLIRATVSNVKIPGNVEVTVNVGAGLSSVKFDPVLFRRVLTNLILNAVQAMPKGGKLTIAGSRGDESFAVAVQD